MLRVYRRKGEAYQITLRRGAPQTLMRPPADLPVCLADVVVVRWPDAPLALQAPYTHTYTHHKHIHKTDWHMHTHIHINMHTRTWSTHTYTHIHGRLAVVVVLQASAKRCTRTQHPGSTGESRRGFLRLSHSRDHTHQGSNTQPKNAPLHPNLPCNIHRL